MTDSIIQRSFAGGEIGPELGARADQIKYQTGLAKCRNFEVMKHGGVQNRSGSGLVNEVKSSAARTYLYKFVFNNSQSYLLEFGNLYIRFYRLGAQIVVSGVAAYNGGTAYVIGDLVVSAGINYYCIQAGTGHTPAISPTFWYPLSGTVYEIPTPYVTADLARLKLFQSNDVIRIVHPNYAPRYLTRAGHTNWVLSRYQYLPSISGPTGVVNSGAAGATTLWVVTSVAALTYEESAQSSSTGSSATPTSGAPITVSWSAVSGAVEYNVYKRINGIFGFIGVAGGTSFIDNGIVPDVTITPPIVVDPFDQLTDGGNNAPQNGGFFQQRSAYCGTNNDPDTVWLSKTAKLDNMSISAPLQEDDSIKFAIVSKYAQEVRHIIDLENLLLLTQLGEFICLGDSDGVLRANQPPNIRKIGDYGSSYVSPVIIGSNILHVQEGGEVVRDLKNDISVESNISKYNGRDLTVFASHLFRGKEIERFDYAKRRESIAWATQDDGSLLGLTYLPEHEIWGWHRHDTDGVYEDVCCVPEENEDIVYVIVNRTINGSTKRYIERFASRRFTDIITDALFLDSYLSYNGINTGSTTMTLSTAGGWTDQDLLTIASSVAYFSTGDVGNSIAITDGDTTVTIIITEYVDTQHVKGYPNKNVPASLQGVAKTTWSKGVDELAGLSHLEGKSVSVLGDGNVVASPNNPKFSTITVTGGSITLPRPYSVIHVGLPYTCDIETLAMDIADQPIRDKKKKIVGVDLLVKDTRGIFIGQDEPNTDEGETMTEGLEEMQPEPVGWGEPWPARSGLIELNLSQTWDESGKFFARQVDPLPATILAAIPTGEIGG